MNVSDHLVNFIETVLLSFVLHLSSISWYCFPLSLPGSLFILTHLIHIIYCRSILFSLPNTLIFLLNQSVSQSFPNSHLWCHHPFWCSVLEAVNMPLLGHSTGTSTPSTSPQEMEDPNSHKSVTVYFIWKSIFQTLFTLLRQIKNLSKTTFKNHTRRKSHSRYRWIASTLWWQ